MSRWIGFCLLFLSLGSVDASATNRTAVETAFQAWLETTIWPLAEAEGVSRATFEAATDPLTLDWKLPDLLPPGSAAKTPVGAFQAEFTGPAKYLSETNLDALARRGRELAQKWSKNLAKVEAQTGVPAEIILAIWGRESNFGSAAIPLPAIRTLATQAFMGSRKESFVPELIAALKIVEGDHLPLELMRSSWAGALGQPQFLPSKFLVHAVDGDGDGRRDIWNSVPDSLASIGHYLKDHGWRKGAAWGAEIDLPSSVSCTLEGPEQGRPVAVWAKLGLTRLDGKPLGNERETAFLMMPAGRMGPAFLVSENFYVLKRYNESDLYALFIGHLADRIAGSARIQGSWAKVGGFSRSDVRDMQERLVAAGHDVGGADGLVGFKTRIAIGRTQETAGHAATCFPDAGLLR